jgi:undecaprenyl-diphosphatase
MERVKSNLPSVLNAIHQWDVVIFLWMMRRKHLAVWTRVCRGVSRSADGFGYPVLGLVLWYWGGSEGALFALTLALGFAIERPLYLILKKGLKRNRPAAALPNYTSFIIPSDKFSFPSGHTSGAFATATALTLFDPALAFLSYTWASLVGISRVTLGVHFPTDTVAGATIGTATILIAASWIT